MAYPQFQLQGLQANLEWKTLEFYSEGPEAAIMMRLLMRQFPGRAFRLLTPAGTILDAHVICMK